MKRFATVAAALLASSSLALAADDGSIPSEVKEGAPAETVTDAPESQTETPEIGGLSEDVKDNTADNDGANAPEDPTAEPDESSLSTNEGEGKTE